MLITQVRLQLTQSSTVKVAQPTLVRPDTVVLQCVSSQIGCAAAGEGALVAAEDDALQVMGEFGSPHLDGNHALLCRRKENI